ncbi:hypothetical protein [Ralstonia thomasii]|jgi:hypothetical protein
MPSKIEDYALIVDCETTALGTPDHGRWRIAPQGDIRHVRGRYLTDLMPVRLPGKMEPHLQTDCIHVPHVRRRARRN